MQEKQVFIPSGLHPERAHFMYVPARTPFEAHTLRTRRDALAARQSFTLTHRCIPPCAPRIPEAARATALQCSLLELAAFERPHAGGTSWLVR
jgi:hypothetical protein